MNKDVIRIKAKIKREDIVFICGVIEAYDEFSITRTIEPKEGIIEFLTSPDFYDDMKAVLNDLSKTSSIKILSYGTKG